MPPTSAKIQMKSTLNPVPACEAPGDVDVVARIGVGRVRKLRDRAPDGRRGRARIGGGGYARPVQRSTGSQRGPPGTKGLPAAALGQAPAASSVRPPAGHEQDVEVEQRVAQVVDRPAVSIARTSSGRYSLWNGSLCGQVLDRKRSFQIAERAGTDPISTPPGWRTRRYSRDGPRPDRARARSPRCTAPSPKLPSANGSASTSPSTTVWFGQALLEQLDVARVDVDAGRAGGQVAEVQPGPAAGVEDRGVRRRRTWRSSAGRPQHGCDGRTPRDRGGCRRRRPSRRSRRRGSNP